MTPTFSVTGFGVKIGSASNVRTVYDGATFSRRGTRARKIDLSQFGTRHGSMIRYCAQRLVILTTSCAKRIASVPRNPESVRLRTAN